ncbi:MAG: hypothetical protein DA328_01975 [Nitrososphaeraceae archaeon]|nr:hypothetical protein [Nitrososphaeraceae archaeon]
MSGPQNVITVYGLSTEGYRLASSFALQNLVVYLIDESARLGFLFTDNLARSYSRVDSIIDDESLFSVQPIDEIISKTKYLFFTPRIRKIGPDAKMEINSKLSDAIRFLNKNSSLIHALPCGFNGNSENLNLIEHTTGLSAGKDYSYYYMPINPISPWNFRIILGSSDTTRDKFLESLLSGDDGQRIRVMSLHSAELSYISFILRHYCGIASMLETYKIYHEEMLKNEDEQISENISDLFINDISNGLFDLRAIQNSLSGAGPLVFLVNGTVRSIESYTKYLTDNLKIILKKNNLKASKTRVLIGWTVDQHEMRGDRIEILSILESKIKDYVTDVEKYDNATFNGASSEKKLIFLGCSKHDYAEIPDLLPSNLDPLFIKANPLCEILNVK